ncbi:DUF29 domain-containing protein [Candidatus Synechococcus calcipolaris G9]|uniref:DUF29 domain-containing protein n=1 Tax=Candidatus Synechococcus calcipolaris G9 TaxID=1497997 RepID=A0ABT6EWE9_9SYNE|nr:DUF29 domain-containing protein [Candidatus Synechococcus calcipolaris]MDG2990107.1 DUF29 domain-containing protein [Candidatus Synechococcus calcipolaris G9]
MAIITDLAQLYETDTMEWLEATINLLKNRQFEILDLENLIEELEDLGNEKHHRVESLLEQIIRHLLLIEFWDMERDHNINHWRSEVIGFRTQLRRRLTANLRNHLKQHIDSIYQDAFKYVKAKTGFNIEFPENCPYTLDQLFDTDWFPEIFP